MDTTLLELEDSHKISQLAIEAKEKAEALSLKNAGQLDEVRERAIKKGIVIQTSQESREQHWLDMERRWREREGWLGAEVVVIRDAEDEERKRLEEAKRMKEEEEARERKKKEEEEEKRKREEEEAERKKKEEEEEEERKKQETESGKKKGKKGKKKGKKAGKGKGKDSSRTSTSSDHSSSLKTSSLSKPKHSEQQHSSQRSVDIDSNGESVDSESEHQVHDKADRQHQSEIDGSTGDDGTDIKSNSHPDYTDHVVRGERTVQGRNVSHSGSKIVSSIQHS
ncbi:hypothetical protein ADUPG1_001657, partial [Aduncisulcus paluster]